MELLEARQLAQSLLAKHGLSDWAFVFDESKVRFGQCRYAKKEIGISRVLASLNDVQNVKDTILHEIAHALVGTVQRHNHVWKNKALEIGCNGKARYSGKEDGVVVYAPYRAECKNCGTISKRVRPVSLRSKVACGECCTKYNGGAYDKRFVLSITKNEYAQ